jgi:predicted nucleic acid-binding protein
LTYVFDACALIAYLKKEPGAIKVKELLDRAVVGPVEEISIFMNIVNLVEVYYGYISEEGDVQKADEIMQPVYALPIQIIDTISDAVYREAARLKGFYYISLADSFAYATASSMSAILVTKDHEFEPVEKQELISILWIDKS